MISQKNNINESIPIVGFFGLSHLGLVTSTVLSSLDVFTICFDENTSLIKSLTNLKTEIREPGLTELLEVAQQNQKFTNLLDDLSKCAIIYISTDVPTDSFGNSDISYIETSILKASSINSNAIIVILSQVPPGFTRRVSQLIPNLICYQVETLVFGDAVERSLHPTRIILGIIKEKETLYSDFFAILNRYNCPILVNNLETAEFAKISINAFLACDVALTNTLADLCEQIGADWKDVASALRLDKRIGDYRYLIPGLGISGGNIERDMRTLSVLGSNTSVDTSLVDSLIQANSHHKKWIHRKLTELKILETEPLRVGILGITYKQKTNSLKNSVAIDVMPLFGNASQIYIYDPAVNSYDFNFKNITYLNSAENIFELVDLLLILTPWDEFKAFKNSVNLEFLKGKVILDPYGILDQDYCYKLGINYFTRGNVI